jgi:hypothetical protein
VPAPAEAAISWWDYALFTWWDPESEVYVMTHHMTSPHASVPGRTRVSVALADRTYEVIEETKPDSHDGEHIAVDLNGRIQVDHPRLKMDVRFTPAYDHIDFHAVAGLPTLKREEPLHHYEQPINATGTVAFPGDERTFSGRGLRDRTWGYRNESAQWAEYIYLMAQLEDSFLVLMRMRGVVDDEPRDMGFQLAAAGQERVNFRFARDGAGLMADCEVDLPSGPLTVTAVEKPAGFWVPMGGRQTGPTFSAYDEFVLLDGSDGGRYAGLATYGVLRHI